MASAPLEQLERGGLAQFTLEPPDHCIKRSDLAFGVDCHKQFFRFYHFIILVNLYMYT